MRQAITTRFVNPTDSNLNKRIRASSYAAVRVYDWDDSLNIQQNHSRAAMLLAIELGWNKYNDFVGGTLPDGGYCFVAIEKGDNDE